MSASAMAAGSFVSLCVGVDDPVVLVIPATMREELLWGKDYV